MRGNFNTTKYIDLFETILKCLKFSGYTDFLLQVKLKINNDALSSSLNYNTLKLDHNIFND